MMDFVDRIITRNLKGDLSGVVKPRPRARYETVEGLAGLNITETAQNSEQSILTHLPPRIREIDYFSAKSEPNPYQPSIALYANAPISEKSPVEPLLGEVKMRVENPRVTVKEPLTQLPPITEILPRQSRNIEPSKVDIEKPTVPPSPAENTVERLTIVERGHELIRPLLPALDQDPIRQRVERPAVVNIDIGRIEVHTPPRVVQQQVTALRQQVRTTRPVRPLDDYLRRGTERKP